MFEYTKDFITNLSVLIHNSKTINSIMLNKGSNAAVFLSTVVHIE